MTLYSNLCALRWLKQVKTNGTTDEFGAYYVSLTGDQRMVCSFFVLACIYSYLFDYLRLTIKKLLN